MRENMGDYRGKRIDNGEWIYGSLVIGYGSKGKIFIFNFKSHAASYLYEVDPSTVGQYTGLSDKNGQKIYEGDKVNRKGKFGVVVFDDSEFSLKMEGNEYIQHGLLVAAWKDDVEVIGNIHDKP